MKRENALLRLSTGIAEAESETDVCSAVVAGLYDAALGYDFVAVLLVDQATGDRVLVASEGWKDAPPGLRIRPGQGLSELPLLDGRIHYTPRVTEETRYLPTRNEGSEADVPILANRELVGVLVVESNRPDAFDEDDLKILTAAANQAGIAIGRARLLRAERARADEQEALRATMADLAGRLDLGTLLKAVLERAVRLLGVSHGELAIYDDETEELEIVANHNIGRKDSTGTRMKLGEGAMGHAARTLEPLIIPDYHEWSGAVGAVRRRGCPLGDGGPAHDRAAAGGRHRARCTRIRRAMFGPEDLRLLNLFAPQAAIAIENARLFTAAQRQREYFEALVSNSPVAIVTLDRDFTTWSPATRLRDAVRLYPSGGRGPGSRRPHHHGRNPAGGRDLHRAGAGAARFTAFAQRRRKDGTLVDVEVLGVPVHRGRLAGRADGAVPRHH